ncbi:TMEM165/GDT1 family protein [Ferrovibrio sp.]|uniref:TMEM165/GDT1 family protein n=1 Tax=Ferrovibrio sp. TaxID=1917215 RepID=UPI0026109056|nr:TMEM165/GDT1 family protein [Ferrovibrio sp.]
MLSSSLSAFTTTTGLVAIAEIGDKTQLLSLLLVTRFRQPMPILVAIACATVANHLLAAALGVWIEGLVEPRILRWALAASFLAMAVWTLIPDKLDENDTPKARNGVFVTTLVAFFLAEIGDKTQLATTALAARFDAVFLVTAASTLGLLLANAPVVLLGQQVVARLPLKPIRFIAAIAFAALGLVMLLVG